jgi:hypothetical protein
MIDRYIVASAVVIVGVIVLMVRIVFPPASPELCFVDRGIGPVLVAGPSGYRDQVLATDASCPTGMRWMNSRK